MSVESDIDTLIHEYELRRTKSNLMDNDEKTRRYRSLNPIRRYTEEERAKLVALFGDDQIGDYEEDFGTQRGQDWKWSGEPISIGIHDWSDVHSETTLYCIAIDRVIYKASQVECLTSQTEYIRECKKWMIEHPQYNPQSLEETYNG